MTPDYWQTAKDYLCDRDTVLEQIISEYDGDDLSLRPDAFRTLARAIVGQQISVKAADSVWRKYENLTQASPETTLDIDHDDLRGCGLSGRKAEYIKNIAHYCHSRENGNLAKIPDQVGDDIFLEYDEMTDEEVIKELCTIKGVGRWTAEMFLIFHLGRSDVFPMADLGIVKAIEKHYDVPREEMIGFSEKWQPYRTVAIWYLWRSLD